jgi:hypothetical protein
MIWPSSLSKPGLLMNHMRGMSPGRNRGESTRFKRIITWAVLGVGIGLVIVPVWFNAFFYPGSGLSGFERHQYEEALLKVGAGFAASESLSLVKLLGSQFRSLGPEKDAFAWGTMLLLSQKQDQVYLWVSLKWAPHRHQWLRTGTFWLADPRDRILFAERQLTNFEKTRFTLENMWREQKRRIREVWSK